MPPSMRPRPPSAPPPAYLQPADGWARPRGMRPTAKPPPPQRPPAFAPSAFRPEPPPEIPSFIGAASRKRKLELAAERGMSLAAWYPSPTPAPTGWGPKHVQPAHSPATQTAPSRPPARPKPAKVAPVARPSAAAAAPGAEVKWIALGADAPFLEQGFPYLGPALSHSPALQGLLSSSNDLLRDLAGEFADTLALTDDPDWNFFPEVGEALKEAGGDEECMCVAQCADLSMWAIGMGNKRKQREQAARLAMCLALAASIDLPADMETTHPEFVRFCERSGIATGFDDSVEGLDAQAERPGTPPRGRGPKRMPPPAWATPAQPRKFAPQPQAAGWTKPNGVQASARPLPTAAAAGGGRSEGRLPRDQPLWITIPASEMPPELEGLSPSALVISTEGKGKKGGLYGCSERALAELLGDEQAEYVDDANWDHFPQIGSALKELASAEECMTVAYCSARDTWAVGVSMKGKDRFAAAKAALATSLALQAQDIGEEPDLSEFLGLADFVEEARSSRGD